MDWDLPFRLNTIALDIMILQSINIYFVVRYRIKNIRTAQAIIQILIGIGGMGLM